MTAIWTAAYQTAVHVRSIFDSSHHALTVVPPASPQHDDPFPMARLSPFSKAVPLIVVAVISLYLSPALINHIFGRPTPIAFALVSLTDGLEHVFVALALVNAGYVVWMTIYDMSSAMSATDVDVDEKTPDSYHLPLNAAAQDHQPPPPDAPPLPLGVHGASLSKRFGSMVVTIPLFGLLIDKYRDESLNAPSAVSREAALAAVVSLRKGLEALGGALMTTLVGGVLCILWDRFGMGKVGRGSGGDEGGSDVDDKLAMGSVHIERTSRRPFSLVPALGTSTPSSSSFSKPAAILLLIVLSLSVYLAPVLIDYIYGGPTPVAASFVWLAGLLDHGLAAFLVANAVYEARKILLERRRRISNPSAAPTPPTDDPETGMAPARSSPPLANRLLLLIFHLHLPLPSDQAHPQSLERRIGATHRHPPRRSCVLPRGVVRRCGVGDWGMQIRLRAWNGVFVGCRHDSLDMLDVPGVVDTTERATFLLHERHPSNAPPRARRLDAAGLVKRLLALILILVTSPTSFGLFLSICIPRHAATKNSPRSPNTPRAIPRFLSVGVVLLLARRRVRWCGCGHAGGDLD
ncbi:hypothetical protein R3P38DRAFT_3211577 [Favolaschia claudopus]|uniref:Uncharacterized protein n=1 Tax=Favolaschia claudopus TaxID=2862362 RepID=A0AAW0AFW0_9AGAR